MEWGVSAICPGPGNIPISRGNKVTRSIRRSPLQRALATTVGVGMAATATLATSGSAFAAPEEEPLSSTFTAGQYIVVLAAAPAATYDGGIQGLDATKPSEGEKFDVTDADVQEYQGHLEAQQDDVAQSADVEIQQSYTTAINGFSADLTQDQALKLSTSKGVIAVVPDEERSLDTVNSPEFLGLLGKNGGWAQGGFAYRAGKGVVVGVIDSGITPENPSFAGNPVSRKTANGKVGLPYRDADGNIAMIKSDGGVFSGECEEGESFSANLCNSKLVSARYFSDGFEDNVPAEERGEFETLSPRDSDGHGTHTAGTAAGNDRVPMVVDGIDFGRGSGMAPEAKVAAYKVCWEDIDPNTGGCYTSDSVAAVNQAIEDGVDVLNYSISGSLTSIIDPVELAFLSASSAGIFVAASAGNSGPTASTTAHNSPWTMTVAASTHHNYPGTVVLGDGTKFLGATSSATGLPEQTPVVLSDDVGLAGADPDEVALCAAETLDPAEAAGNIVVCDRGVYDRVSKSAEVARAGGVGMILVNVVPGSLDADLHAVPTVHLADTDRDALRAYVSGNDAATAALLPGNSSGQPDFPVPVTAGFSSRGPALANGGDLLKPDITAPGVNVLAAVAPGPNQGRDFSFLSGTSMSSPHIAGLGALILGKNPNWSPAAIKSAMMTTAYDLKNDDGTADTNLFNSGAGHVDPRRFFNPGLVYEATADDYLAFLEGTGVGTGIPDLEPIDPSDLNYPSIAVGELTASQTVTRTVTAVTPGLYRAAVDMPGYSVQVTPSVLNFSAAGETRDFRVTITRDSAPLEEYGFGHLTWSGGDTTVRSPIAVKPVTVSAPEEVVGEGAEGSAEFEVVPGVTGAVDMEVRGLTAGERHEGSGVPGPVEFASDASNGVYEFTVPEGTATARFDLAAADQAADLDLYVINPSFTAFVPDQGAGATGAANERITVDDPEPGTYTVIVNVFDSPGGGETAWTLENFAVPATDEGNLVVEPNPLQAVAGEPTTVTASWSGLDADTPYLGYITYEGSPARTFVTIN